MAFQFDFASMLGSFAGKHLGNEGTVMTLATKYSPINPNIFLGGFMVIAVYWMIQEFRTDQKQGLGAPLALLVVSGSFFLSSAFAVTMVYLAIMILAGNTIINFKHMSRGGQIGSFVMFILIGWLLFQNPWSLLIFGGIGAVIIALLRKKEGEKEKGTKKARRLRAAAGITAGLTGKAIRGLGKATRAAHRAGKGGLGWVTSRIATMAQKKVEVGGHAATIAGGTVVESQKVEDMAKAEQAGESRDLQVLQAIIGTARDMGATAAANMADEQKSARLKADGSRLSQLFEEVTKDDKYSDKYRHETTKAIVEASGIMLNAAEAAKDIIQSEIHLNHALRNKVRGQMKHLQKEVATKDRQIQSIKQKQPGIEKEHEVLKSVVEKISTIYKKLNVVIHQSKTSLKEMKAEAENIVTIEKEAEAFGEKSEQLEGHIGEIIEKLADAQKKFSEEMAKFSKDELPEKVLAESIENVKEIFEELKKAVERIIEFNKNEVQPVIQKNAKSLQGAWKLEKAGEFGQRVTRFETYALEELAKIISFVGSSEEKKGTQKVMGTEELMKKVEAYEIRKTGKVEDKIKKTYGDLSNATKMLENQISYLEKEKQMVEEAEKETVTALNEALAAMTKKRTAEFEQAERAGEIGQAASRQAAREAKQERRTA